MSRRKRTGPEGASRPVQSGDNNNVAQPIRTTDAAAAHQRCEPGTSASQAADYLAARLSDGGPLPAAELDVVVHTDCQPPRPFGEPEGRK